MSEAKSKSLKIPSWDDIAWTYCGVALSVIWYVFKGSDDVIYIAWALGFFIHATAQRIIREIRLQESRFAEAC